MAKKNSSKTATEKAIQSSEPRLITFRNWQGVNFVDAPLTWQPLEDFHQKPDAFNQTNLPDNFLMVQNNINTTDTMALETRMDSIKIKDAPEGFKFTGVVAMHKHWLFCAARSTDDTWYESIFYRSLLNESEAWHEIKLRVGNTDRPEMLEVGEIGFFESNIVATVRDYNNTPDTGVLMLASVVVNEANDQITITGTNWYNSDVLTDTITDTPKICPDTNYPTVRPEIEKHDVDGTAHHVSIKYCYTNRLGSTLTHLDSQAASVDIGVSPTLFTTSKYLTIKPDHNNPYETQDVTSITGIDFYYREDENIEWIFIAHMDITEEKVRNGDWSYNWYGAMTDISQWATAQLKTPTDNTTHGPDAVHFASHDSRMYFWGMPSKPYRLWIGGNPGSEFSVARGLGGAWVDIEPGSGYDIKGTAKWKTTSGSNIVTIMCGNRNTTKIERFNLVETNLTYTNEVAYKSYMYEQVSNVVGCNSRWGYGVYDEGLYSLNRYGLMLTTMASEYNNQMKNQSVSDVIEPIFTNCLGKQLSDGRMVYINGVIYIALSEEDDSAGLGNVILCYDTSLKAWYTWTHDQVFEDESLQRDKILHIFAIDSDEFQEGLGAITETEVRLYPVTGQQGKTVPEFQVLIETGELAPRQPMQAYWYIQQLEFRFDYFIGMPDDPATVLVEGVDYYGRFFQIEKKLNKRPRSWQPLNDNGLVEKHTIVGVGSWEEPAEQRNYTEWIRIDKIVQSIRIRIKGHARFRLTHINARVYQQADTISTPYGFDSGDMFYTYRNMERGGQQIHHYIDDYNNLRRAVVS